MEYKPMTVTDLNLYVKEKFVNDEFLNNVLVKGEISNYKKHYTGHLYFTLKDENSLIKCVMFKSYADKLQFEPKEGSKVIVFGTVSVYERDGVYQIYTKAMEEDGVGDLYKKFQQLKQDLEKQGYFDQSHKKPIPKMPKKIGVLTSKTGSVVRDIINVSTRRDPNVNLRILPVPVQGEGAAEKIAKAIEYMNKHKLADVLIIARGGGSLEDLWPFNEKVVADAIYNSELPVISAVGHETDFTIADFVADLRAPTPSAAAELAVPNIRDVIDRLQLYQKRLRESLIKKLEYMRLVYQKCISSRVFKEPKRFIYDDYQKLDTYLKRLETSVKIRQKEEKTKYVELVAKLDALSPLKTLTRGYSITQFNGKVVKSSKDLNSGDEVELKFVDGNRNATII
ncbi:MAG: exodeoxyribonuclease VII large subunit [Clostridia bacterium]|nr:exodeoxyribonuclease VII large subunit [Clostridia bacterium]